MKYNLLFLLSVFMQFSMAQEKGIVFEKGKTWAQIKVQAKKENKYIFLDGYTTWCVPCKQMDMDVFPKPEVGRFFNENFINVAVQFDVTAKDNNAVKSWYKDAKDLQKTYNIDSYPTYLFFNPDGNLVHVMKGASLDVNDFISKAKQALNSETQYINLKKQYHPAMRDSVFLLNLIDVATQSGDYNALPAYMNTFLLTQKDLFTARNLKFIANATTRSTDIGFLVLLNHPEKLDFVAGKGKSSEILKTIAFDEIVLPMIRVNGKKTIYGGGMVVYSEKVIPNVNWAVIKERVAVQYADLSDDIIRIAKPHYYEGLNDWENFCSVVSSYENDLEADQMNAYARKVLLSCDNVKHVQQATRWSEKTVRNNGDHPWYLLTYSQLLYKSGQKELAIEALRKAVEVAVPNDKQYMQDELKRLETGT